ncbi:MAG: hypothetical protein SGI83_18350 [Bacteroidota bacterium]|nr:hypothetical protein [Bacteroidota bacterium]
MRKEVKGGNSTFDVFSFSLLAQCDKIKKMEKNSTLLVDEHLQSILGMREAGTDDFFYTRLKARMLARQSGGEKEKPEQGWNFPLKPVWVVGALALLLAVNGFMLSNQFKGKKSTATAAASSLQNFAESYDQSISSSY